MADRMHPYPMFPQSLTPNSLQQSQIPQQPPQSQQPDPQMISALSNPEHTRMWQLQNQLQNPYRPQQSGDLAASQMTHQEFARGQALSHGQGQPIVQQIPQSFGLNAQRMNPPGPVFHDPQNNQSLIPSNFPNMPMNTQQQLKAPFNMNPIMHAAMNNPALSHQLKMLNHPQEMVRLQQQGLGAQHAPNQPTAVDMFPSSSIQPSPDQMHASPHPAQRAVGPPGPNQGMVPGNQQPNMQKRAMTPADFQDRRLYLMNLISQSESGLVSLMQNARSGNSVDPQLQQKISQLRAELANRRDVYTKFIATFGAMFSQQIANGIQPPHINPTVHPASQQPQQGTMPNAQVQLGRVVQRPQLVAPQYDMSAGNGPSPMPAQNQGVLNQQIPIQPPQLGPPNSIVPRARGTPHPIPGSQLPPSVSPNPGNFVTQGGQKIPNQTSPSGGIMPLDQQRFISTYSHFCRSQNRSPTLEVQIGDRTINLHDLHVRVMHEGGGKYVTTQDIWPIIGGRLGIIQFPGNDTEPARCGPGIAQQLRNTYDQYLQHFEDAYVVTVKNRTAGSSQQSTPHMNPAPLPMTNNATPPGMPGNPAGMPRNHPRQATNPQFIAAAMRYAHVSAQDMRSQQVPEQVIAFVERYRSELQRVYQQQVQGGSVKKNPEQEQQNTGNMQGQPSSVHEQGSMGLQPVAQRPQVGMPPEDVKPVTGSFIPDTVAATISRQPPTQDQIQQAIQAIIQLKHVFEQRRLPGMTPQPIPEEQRPEYKQLLEQVHKMTSELEARLHLYLVVFKNEELIRKFVAIVMTVARQQQLMSASPPQYIINLTALRTMQGQIYKLNEEFESRWRAMRSFAAANSQNHAPVASVSTRVNPTPPSVPPIQNISQIAPSGLPNNGRQVSINPSPQPTQLHPPPSHPQLQPPPLPQPNSHPNLPHPPSQPPIKKPFPPSPSAPPVSATVASPTPPPAASTSTPVTSAATPQTAAGSPQTPKSPPSKAPKVKSTNRAPRKPSATAKGSATPEMAPSVIGIKRAPEEDVSTLANIAPLETEPVNAPSPKKIKTEWEGEPSEALVKKQQEVENIKTEEDAVTFFNQMKELFTMSEGDLPQDIACTLDQILAGVAQDPVDAAATAAALSARGAGDAGPPPTALSPHIGANDAFLEFVDFSLFTTLGDEDDDSKAPTPDLVHSSEANPSPESGSEGDLLGNVGSPDKTKIEESGDRSDPLRLGSLREIDGGESAYYQGDTWKWEGPMHMPDQPWAISNS